MKFIPLLQHVHQKEKKYLEKSFKCITNNE
jgi:hypothetical protein